MPKAIEDIVNAGATGTTNLDRATIYTFASKANQAKGMWHLANLYGYADNPPLFKNALNAGIKVVTGGVDTTHTPNHLSENEELFVSAVHQMVPESELSRDAILGRFEAALNICKLTADTQVALDNGNQSEAGLDQSHFENPHKAIDDFGTVPVQASRSK